MRVDAIRSDRAAIDFRNLPPAARDELVSALGDKIAVQESDLELRQSGHAEPQEESRSTTLTCPPRADPCHRPLERRAGLAKIAVVRTVGGIVFPGLAAGGDQGRAARTSPAIWPDIEKSRAEAKRLLKEAGAEGLSFELLNRDLDQPFKYLGTWLVDEWSKVGLNVTQRMLPVGPWFEALRNGSFEVGVERQLPERHQPGPRRADNTCRARSMRRITEISTTRRRSISTTRCCARPTRQSSGR